ncbi:MAG: L-threonylcarbamoyladenylate synthase [Flavobacteriaceae bacterium]
MTFINPTLKALRQKKIILYPTDTVWGIGGDATDPDVVQQIYQLKQRADHKALIALVSSLDMLGNYMDKIPDTAQKYLQDERPTTLVYPNAKGIATNLMGADQSMGFRIPKNDFCLELIRSFGKPLISTSANISGLPTPKNFKSIDQRILEGVDYIVPLKDQNINQIPSQVIKIDPDGGIQILRA